MCKYRGGVSSTRARDASYTAAFWEAVIISKCYEKGLKGIWAFRRLMEDLCEVVYESWFFVI
jgi:hypothetical protein